MVDLLWLVPALPLTGFLILALAGGALDARRQRWVGIGSVGLSAVVALAITIEYLVTYTQGEGVDQYLWRWFEVAGLDVSVGLYLDPLAALMISVVTGVGFLIHLYSGWYMSEDEGQRRFFATMNLFVAAMTVLVLADNLVLLFLGWEGVGLCSYLLIGHWYRNSANGAAARKAFIITRIGDTAFAIGLFLLFAQLGTLSIQPLLGEAAQRWDPGAGMATFAAACLLAGAIGKSAQVPLQTWLPDAMAGPTPVSALLHAATMVTAGVYLIARMHGLFALAPGVQAVLTAIGGITLLLAAVSAITQTDIKRVLAYSTMSQVGYMFFALGLGAWTAAGFHFMTHAFFKALLFLCAGVVIRGFNEDHHVFRMGGVRRQAPWLFAAFTAGAASLAAIPFVTAGYFSKGMIIGVAAASPHYPWAWWVAWSGAVLTGLYSFRLVFLVFYGEARQSFAVRSDYRVAIPLGVFAILSIAAGWFGGPLVAALAPSFGGASAQAEGGGWQHWADIAAPLIGLGLAYWGYVVHRPEAAADNAWARFSRGGLGFDWLYKGTLVRGFTDFARLSRNDVVDGVYTLTAAAANQLHSGLSTTQNGMLRRYMAGFAGGAIVIIAVMVLT